MSNDANDSKSQPPASPAHNASSLSGLGGDDLGEGEGEGIEPMAPDPAVDMTESESPSRDSPPQKELPVPPSSASASASSPPKKAPPKSPKTAQEGGTAAGGGGGGGGGAGASCAEVESLAQVVANVTLNLRMHEGTPVASAQVSLRVA